MPLTTDRVAGAALVLIALFTLEESWRLRLPLGSLTQPGPAYMPVLLAVLLLVFGTIIVALGASTPRINAVGWTEWRHAVAIFAASAFAALALERLGYRLTVTLTLLFLVKVVERKGVVLSLGVALGMAWATFYLFNTLLRVPLPVGPLGL